MANIILRVKGLFDVDEARHELGIGYMTLYRWIAKGDITPVRINGHNYFPKSEVERLKEERRRNRET